MKRIFLTLVALAAVFGLAGQAMAIPLGSDTWPEGKDWDTISSDAAFVHVGSALDFQATGEAGGDRFSGYAAKSWGTYNSGQSFSYAYNFYDSYSGDGSNGLDTGLLVLGPDNMPAFTVQGSIESYEGGNHFRLTADATGDNDLFNTAVNLTQGWLGFTYDKDSKILNFSLFAQDGTWLLGREIADPFALAGAGELRVFLAGNTRDENIEANTLGFSQLVENPELSFGVTPNAAPEPVSCSLFLLGGGALALLRRKK